jgi:hypothetical protein
VWSVLVVVTPGTTFPDNYETITIREQFRDWLRKWFPGQFVNIS